MKKALVVGINKYKDPRDNLRGCVPDARNVIRLLKKVYNFRHDAIKALVNEKATRKNILGHLDWLMRNTKSGDVIAFHFSGHGSQIRDRSGDELNDHLDEIICPYDMDWKNPLSDDVLKRKFSKLPKGVRMYLTFDCCHSGTVDRSNPHSPDVDGTFYKKSRFLEPPLELAVRGDVRELKRNKVGLKNGEWCWFSRHCPQVVKLVGSVFPAVAERAKKKPPIPKQRHIMISGCRDNQTSADAFIQGGYAGALTWHLVDALTRYPNQPIQEVHRKARRAILNAGYTQDSQFWGPPALRNLPFCHAPA